MIVRHDTDISLLESAGIFKANPKVYKLDDVDYNIHGWDDGIGDVVKKLDKKITNEIKGTYDTGLCLAKLINKTQDKGAIKRWKTLTRINKDLKRSRKKLSRLNVAKAPKVTSVIDTIVLSSQDIRNEIETYITNNIRDRKAYQG